METLPIVRILVQIAQQMSAWEYPEMIHDWAGDFIIIQEFRFMADKVHFRWTVSYGAHGGMV